jgi:hypothetical protein
MFDMRKIELRPSVMQFAWAGAEQTLTGHFDQAHRAGRKVTYIAEAVPEPVRAANAGADIINSQGTSTPNDSAATRPGPSTNPPAARSEIGATASTTIGMSRILAAQPAPTLALCKRLREFSHVGRRAADVQ